MEGCKDSIIDVCFEQIKDDYWFGAYEEFRVILNKKTEYLNATKMCTSAKKELFGWTRQKGMHELNQILKDTMALENTHGNIQNSDLTLVEWQTAHLRFATPTIIKVATTNETVEDKLISGTYIHPDLVPSLAGWISPIFQLKTNRIRNGFIAWQYKAQLEESRLALQATQVALQVAQAALQDSQASEASNNNLLEIQQIEP